MLNTYIKECLYFTANRLSRVITKMAEDEFAEADCHPHMLICLWLYMKEGISQKELGEILHLHLLL